MNKTIRINNNASAIAAAPLSLEEKMWWHIALVSGVPKSMHPVLCLAIYFFDMGVSSHKTLPLPKGSTYYGRREATLLEIIEGHQLEPYLKMFADYLPSSPLEVPLNNS